MRVASHRTVRTFVVCSQELARTLVACMQPVRS